MQPACDKQFSNDVIEYSHHYKEIINWLSRMEKELEKRPDESSLQDSSFDQLLDEYSQHEKSMTELSEYCHTIMKFKEDGLEMRDNREDLTDEERDDVGIQLDRVTSHYGNVQILMNNRLHSLRKIIETRQRSKIERLEEWLSNMEMRIASSSNIGPDYNAIQLQLREIDDLRNELEQKQDFLNLISRVVIFDDIEPDSMQTRSRSCESLEEQLETMNRRWTAICLFVDSKNAKLRKAESIWKVLNLESPQLLAWLNKIEVTMDEVSVAARNIVDPVAEKAFIGKLLSRSDKIDQEIKSKQSFYTSLENRVRVEIEKFDDPCSMLVIELEKKLEDLQDYWNTIMNRKRTLDYSLNALSNPIPNDPVRCMIPVPDPITSNSNNDLTFNNSTCDERRGNRPETFNELLNNSSSSGNDDKDSSLLINGSLSEPKAFDNSLSSDTRSLLYGIPEQASLMIDNDSQDELSSTTNLTSPHPIMNINSISGNEGSSYNCTQSSVITNDQQELNWRTNQTNACDDLFMAKVDCVENHNQDNGGHNCRVEEWRHSLESFSNWLKQVEVSLAVDSPADMIESTKNPRDENSWPHLDLQGKISLLNDIETCIKSTCQDEFDCLLLQGQHIIEDLMPEIGENEYEANLKEILADIEIRYEAVKRCLVERMGELTDKEKWRRLSKALRNSCDYLIEQRCQIIPETNIGVDLISLAQQQEQLIHAKEELENDLVVQSNIQEAKLFLTLCDSLQQQYGQHKQRFSNSSTNSTNVDLWLSFKDFREEIEDQLDKLTLHFSELSQLIEDRLARLEEVHKEMHALQHKIQDLATKLQVAEILRSNWVPLENLTIEQLSEQLEDLKLYRERLSEIESAYKIMNSIFDWMTQSDVPLSQQNLNRIGELNTIWSVIEVAVDERQKLIEQAFDDQSGSEQKFLVQTVADLPLWERRVATSKVPYFIDHETNKTSWDHPKFTQLLNSMSEMKRYVFAVYRTALKLRMIQKRLSIDMLMLEHLKEIFNSINVHELQHVENGTQKTVFSDDTPIGVERIILFLRAIYERIQMDEVPTLDVPLVIDLTLNWLLNLYDSTRTGFINALSLKVGLTLLCCATREEKYIYMYELVANQSTGTVDAKKLGTLFETCMRIPIYLGEGESFGGAELIETSIRNCFSMSKFNPQYPNCIDLTDYLNWLKSEPQFIIWLPVLHRLLVSENTVHNFKCKLCGANPIIGLRYRCLKCFKFNICQKCFLTGRHIEGHHDPAKHPMQEYLCKTSSGEKVRDFAKIVRNKLYLRT